MPFLELGRPIRTKSIVIIACIALAAILGAYVLWFRGSSTSAPLEAEYVTSPSLDLLDTPAVVHKVLAVLKYGDQVEILKKEGTWARVRTPSGHEGWLITNELVPAKIYEGGRELLHELSSRQVQATGHTVLATNIHLQPDRDAPDLGMLTEGLSLDVFDRRMVARKAAGSKTRQMSSSPAPQDAWYLVRSGPRAGWILGRRITLDIPQAISQYAANYNTVAWFVLNTVRDGDANVPQYLAADREGTVEYDFTHVRVFTWSVRAHHYVTSFVKSGLRGSFPIRVEHIHDIPYFRLRLVDRKGNKYQSIYGLFHTLVRPVGTVKGWESTAMPARRR